MVNTKLPYNMIINSQVKSEYRILWKPKDKTRTEDEISRVSGSFETFSLQSGILSDG